jgi:hypothetical protein
MRKLLAVCLLAAASLVWNVAAEAQSTAPVILPGGCGTGSFISDSGYLTMDSTGKLCVNTSSAGGTIANQGTPNTKANAWPMEITDGVNGPANVGLEGQDGLVGASLLNTSSQMYLWSGTNLSLFRDVQGSLNNGFGAAGVGIIPNSSANAAIVPVVSTAAENSHILKTTAGNLYSVYATNLTATAGFLVLLNASGPPADGAITPLECVPLPANGTASLNYNPGPVARFSTGIVAVATSATSCFTKTTGTITAFFKGAVQ